MPLRLRMRIVVVCCPLVSLASLCHPTNAAAQSGFVSGGFLEDIKRYSSDSSGPQVYDGQAAGGYLGAGAFITKRFSAEFEVSFSGDTTTTVTVPLLVNGTTTNFTSTYTTRLQTYSALFAVHTAPSSRLHLSYRGGVTFVHHRRDIIPPQILPMSPETNTVPMTTTVIENVAGPTAGIDADVILAPHFAIVGALRLTAFTVATDLSAFSIRPMVGARVRF
jgi:hypothetical protein